MKALSLLPALFLLSNIAAFSDDSFSRISTPEEDLYSVAVSPFNANLIFAGSDNSIFKSTDRGESFERIFTVKGDSKTVNKIIFDPYRYQKIFFATDSGLYVSDDLGKTAQKVFKARGRQGNFIQCLSLAKSKNLIYLGTDNGLHLGEEDIYKFRRVQSIPHDAVVSDIKLRPSDKSVILATSKGVYLGNIDSGKFERSFISRSSDEFNEILEDEETSRNEPRCIYAEEGSPIIYLGTSSGLFKSGDAGKSFRKVHAPGLAGLNIRRIGRQSPGEDVLYLATAQGFYRLSLDKKELQNIYSGLASGDVRDLALNKEPGDVLLASSAGLYKSSEVNSKLTGIDQVEGGFNSEPTYMEVQEAALYYNNIHPDKTRRWQHALRYRAFVPRVSLDYDKTINYDSGADRYFVGPHDWGISVSWDFADLIWNSYQDDVDTRVRLNTQTRIDILDDVRRIYFERRKLKLELTENPPGDSDKLIEKQLYLEELTATLDSYTGGFFSRKICDLQGSPYN